MSQKVGKVRSLDGYVRVVHVKAKLGHEQQVEAYKPCSMIHRGAGLLILKKEIADQPARKRWVPLDR